MYGNISGRLVNLRQVGIWPYHGLDAEFEKRVKLVDWDLNQRNQRTL